LTNKLYIAIIDYMLLEQQTNETHKLNITNGPFDQDLGHDISKLDVDAINPNGVGRTVEMLDPFASIPASDELPGNVTPISDAPSLRTDEGAVDLSPQFDIPTQLVYIEKDPANHNGLHALDVHEPRSLGRAVMRALGLKPMPGSRTHQRFDPKAEAKHRDRINQQFGGPVVSHRAQRY